MAVAGQGYVDVWRPWRKDAEDGEKIDILHQQIESIRGQIGDLRTRTDRSAAALRNDIRDAKGRVTGQLRPLESEIRGERTQASRVDARGFGPLAFGIVLTGLADGLAAVAVVGWVLVGVAIAWVICVSPGWLRDFKQALMYDDG